MQLFPQFAISLCKRWDLPVMGADVGSEKEPTPSSPAKYRKVLHALEDLPKHHGDECPPINWWREHGCFCFVVDCKPLAEVLCGHVPLHTPNMVPLFERVASSLFQLLEGGMTPCEQSEDPVLWHKRDFNRIVDFAVNHTMDYKRSWLHNFKCPVVNFRTSEANYVCHSDGGTRANSCSGAAWIIEARVVRNDHRHVFPVAMAGVFLQDPVSSFLAEAIALEEAVNFLGKYLR